jgi:transposase
VRVTLEATGVYSLDLALALEETEGFEVEVLNPKKASDFAKSLGRSKTDKTDAAALAEYSQRMKFVAWRRPSRHVLELRALGRHLATLTEEHTRLRNRLHAAQASRTAPPCVRQDLKRTLAGVGRRLLRLRREARTMIDAEPEMKRKLLLLVAMPGIADTSAVQILAELAGLDEEMTVRQWVAHSGLDPAHETSGTSVQSLSAQGALHARADRGAIRSPSQDLLSRTAGAPQIQAPGPYRRSPQNASCHLRHLQNRYSLRRRQALSQPSPPLEPNTHSYLLGKVLLLLLPLLFNRESSLRSEPVTF